MKTLRDYIRIVEGFHTAFKNDRGDTVEVFENPSRSEFLRLIHESHAGLLRAWVWKNRIVVWDAYLSTHDVDFDLDPEMKNFNDGGFVNSVILSRDAVVINHSRYYGETPDAAMENAKRQFNSCSALTRIYGVDVPVRI